MNTNKKTEGFGNSIRAALKFAGAKLGIFPSGALYAIRTKPPMVLENDQKAVGLIGAANDLTGDEWVQISPLGEFPHRLGLQRVDNQAVTEMANRFKSIRSQLSRRFGGVPFFVGHPDMPGMANEYPDRKAYGWVMDLEARADGLYGKTKWNEEGKKLVENGAYKFFSPYWGADEVGHEGGKLVLRPVELFSVGLTNQPNIPVLPLSNEKENNNKKEEQMDKLKLVLIGLLGLANEATDEQVIGKVREIHGQANKVTPLENEKSTTATALENERTEHNKTKEALKTERKARVGILLDNAISDGRITAAERPGWETALENDFATKSSELALKQKTIKTQSATENLGDRKVALANEAARRSQVQLKVGEKMRAGLSYDEAFAAVRLENAALFTQMAEPKAE